MHLILSCLVVEPYQIFQVKQSRNWSIVGWKISKGSIVIDCKVGDSLGSWTHILEQLQKGNSNQFLITMCEQEVNDTNIAKLVQL